MHHGEGMYMQPQVQQGRQLWPACISMLPPGWAEPCRQCLTEYNTWLWQAAQKVSLLIESESAGHLYGASHILKVLPTLFHYKAKNILLLPGRVPSIPARQAL